MTHSVLVFGATGQVGRELARAAWPAGIAPTFLDRNAADFTRPETLEAIVREHAPRAVIIAAAYTDVDGAQSDEVTAMTVNAVAPAKIANAAATLDIPVVAFSTDYVFDGDKTTPYVETDPINPINAYGRTKLAGEIALRAANPRHLILRTSWVYSAHGTNFLKSMLRFAAEKEKVTIVADQHGCPTAAHDLAAAIARIAPRLISGDVPWGTYHLAGSSETTWHGFAEAIFVELEKRGQKRPVNDAITTADFPRPARRPLNSRLSSATFEKTFGFALPGYETSVPLVLGETASQ
jgi:dTDP-4-dehydrorhamnose reductase